MASEPALSLTKGLEDRGSYRFAFDANDLRLLPHDAVLDRVRERVSY
jgi:hypothetical protein